MDQFPITDNVVDVLGVQSTHVETVCLLAKLNVDEHVYIDFEMSELDITSAEKKVSYEQIKSYVLEHNGLKVSHLNIAQIKRKHRC